MGNLLARAGVSSLRGWRRRGVAAMWVLPSLLTGAAVCDVYHRLHGGRLAALSWNDGFIPDVTRWTYLSGLGVDMESATSARAPTADEEFEKNPGLKREDIATLREWLTTEKHLPPVTDEMLIVFHHSCYHDLERTMRCIENYYTMRTHAPEFFTDRDVTSPELAKALEALNLTPLPLPDPNTGYRIMYHGLQISDPSKYEFVQAVKLTFMMFDAFAHEHGTTPGFAVLFDMEGTKIGHLFRVNLSALRKYIQYMQEASPVRLKAIHMVNANGLVDKALLLAKPFMKQELVDLIHIHKPGSESLYEHIPRQCLPKEFGGSLDSKDVYYAAHLKTLERLAHFFKAEEKNRVNEDLRDKKKKKKKQTPSAEPKLPEDKMNIH